MYHILYYNSTKPLRPSQVATRPELLSMVWYALWSIISVRLSGAADERLSVNAVLQILQIQTAYSCKFYAVGFLSCVQERAVLQFKIGVESRCQYVRIGSLLLKVFDWWLQKSTKFPFTWSCSLFCHRECWTKPWAFLRISTARQPCNNLFAQAEWCHPFAMCAYWYLPRHTFRIWFLCWRIPRTYPLVRSASKASTQRRSNSLSVQHSCRILWHDVNKHFINLTWLVLVHILWQSTPSSIQLKIFSYRAPNFRTCLCTWSTKSA